MKAIYRDLAVLVVDFLLRYFRRKLETKKDEVLEMESPPNEDPDEGDAKRN